VLFYKDFYPIRQTVKFKGKDRMAEPRPSVFRRGLGGAYGIADIPLETGQESKQCLRGIQTLYRKTSGNSALRCSGFLEASFPPSSED
jgi:hypothetical protein